MKNSKILIFVFIAIILIAGFYFLSKPILFAPATQVIIVDTTIKTGVPDIVDFLNVQNNAEKDTTAFAPTPFVIENGDGCYADVSVYAANNLFSSPSSQFKYSIERARPVAGWSTSPGIDDCGLQGGCFASSDILCSMPNFCDMPVGEVNKRQIISDLYFQDIKDEAFMHIKVKPGNDEPAGDKSADVYISAECTWYPPSPHISIELVDPNLFRTVERNEFFDFAVRITCSDADCGNVRTSLFSYLEGCNPNRNDCTDSCGDIFLDSPSPTGFAYNSGYCEVSDYRVGNDCNGLPGSGQCARTSFAGDIYYCSGMERAGHIVTSSSAISDCICLDNGGGCAKPYNELFNFENLFFTQLNGLISTAENTIPFYTTENLGNPGNMIMTTGQSVIIPYPVKATGRVGDIYDFFATAEMTEFIGEDATPDVNVYIWEPCTIKLLPPNTIRTKLTYEYDLADLSYSDHESAVYGTEARKVGMQMKWDISSIPSGVAIKDSQLCLFVKVNDAGLGSVYQTGWYINNETWGESISAEELAIMPLGEPTQTAMCPNPWRPAIWDWICFDVTNQLGESYYNGNSKFAIRLEDTDYLVPAINSLDAVSQNLWYGYLGVDNPVREAVAFASKEWSFGPDPAAIRPYLNVTYAA